MRRFVVTLVVAAILAVASLFPLARSAYAEPADVIRNPWIDRGETCFTSSGDPGYGYFNNSSGIYQCFRA